MTSPAISTGTAIATMGAPMSRRSATLPEQAHGAVPPELVLVREEPAHHEEVAAIVGVGGLGEKRLRASEAATIVQKRIATPRASVRCSSS